MTPKAKALFSLASDVVNNDGKYTHKIQVPQYEPSEKKPHIEELCNIKKYSQLISDINKSGVSEEEKRFLRFAASRHIVFNYAKVADYYAHASKEMQELMEQSALVIIDMDDAIANGYVKLSKRLSDIMELSGEESK
jgi:hypothetical protein